MAEIEKKLVKAEGNTELSAERAIRDLSKDFATAYKLVDDIILKNYLTFLSDLEVKPLDPELIKNNFSRIRLFKITEMVYQQDESATYKFTSVFNAVAATDSAIITIIDSDGVNTNFYLGIRSLNVTKSTKTSFETLENAIKGQFPGIKIENLREPAIMKLLKAVKSDAVAAVSCVANNKNKDFVNNREYLQGLEKLALAMQGNRYTAVIIANPAPRGQLNNVRREYEKIYTQLSPYANAVISQGENISASQTDTETHGENRVKTTSETGSETVTETRTENEGEIIAKSEPTVGSKIGRGIAAGITAAGAIIGSMVPVAGTAAGTAVGTAAGTIVGAAIGGVISLATNKTTSTTTGGGSRGSSTSVTRGTSTAESHGESDSLAKSLGFTQGKNGNFQLTLQNKTVVDMLERIDKQIKRIDEFESIGMWECAAYFMGNSSVSEVAAATYKALMAGEGTGVEVSAINTWINPSSDNSKEKSKNELIVDYVLNLIHPEFEYSLEGVNIPVEPANFVSGNELAIHMGLPRHSVCGFPVVEHTDFAKEVVNYDEVGKRNIPLGSIFNMGSETTSEVKLDVDSLSMHTFITGSTGSGKSNTVCGMVRQLKAKGIKYLIIEPAKGEYKNFFGTEARVLGTNPDYTELLKINPFKFPNGVHVLEHVDRLVEIFNVCWPMYAAMPAVLKEAVLKSYEMCGWDLATSKNTNSYDIYPTFRDLLDQLIVVIDNSGYSEEVKSNYKGSLITRVKSLTNGLNGMIFSSDEIDNKILFDEDVVVDLSRVGSQETKSLLMGILVMRLSEHRMTHAKGANAKLKHITVLEEAHNLLRAHITATTEDGGNVGGKSVEMISNAIAEMRTYGEGFIIADQSPNAVDMSAIRNTNTKIIMRLPEEFDRRVAGKAAALKDEQLDEIAKLPKGVAVVYQNDWVEPVLCKISKYDGEEKEYHFNNKDITDSKKTYRKILINWIIKNRLDNPEHNLMGRLSEAIEKIDCGIDTRMQLYALFKEHKNTGKLSIWEKDGFPVQAKLVSGILDIGDDIGNLRKISADMAGFRLRLNTIIGRKIDQPSDDEVISIAHCLLKEYSKNDKEFNLYEKWREETEGRRHII